MNLVNEEQLLTALDAQEARAPSLHRLAVEAGALSPETALEVLDLRARGDERAFEVIAQEQYWLTREDLDALYRTRARRRPRLGEVLVRLGYLSREQLQRALETPDLPSGDSMPADSPPSATRERPR